MKKIILFVVGVMVGFLLPQNTQAQWAEVGGLDALAANGPIKTMCADKAGNIYAAGGFRNDSGYFYVAKWDGNNWSELGGVNGIKANDTINTICSDKQGNIYAGGRYIHNYSDSYVKKWDGNNWIDLSPNPMDPFSFYGSINALCSDAQGNVYVAGDLSAGSAGGLFVSKWNGSSWVTWTTGIHGSNEFYSICSNSSGSIFACGDPSGLIYWHNGGAWYQFGPIPYWWTSRALYTSCSDIQGNVYVGGEITNGNYPGMGYYYVAYGNGSTWAEVGGKNALAANQPIRSVFRASSSKLFAAGDFTNASGSQYVAMFNGVGWSELGGNNSLAANGTIRTICEDTAGNIYVAGDFKNASGHYYVASIDKSLSVSETHNISISISPNPTKNSITIKGIAQPSVAVYNIMGQKVVAAQGSNELSLAQLPTGLYLVQVFNKDMELVKSEQVVRE